jgi:hypothetical protein
MSDDPKFTVQFTGPQLDFVGKFIVDSLNQATATAKMAQEVYQLLRASVQPAQQAAKAVANGQLQVVPEVEVDVSPRSPIP